MPVVGIQLILRFVFQVVIGTLVSMLLVQYVRWKALSVLLMYSITNVICSVISISTLVCSNWKKTALVVTKNTSKNARIGEEIEGDVCDLALIKSTFGFMLLVSTGYLFCILTSFLLCRLY